MSFIKKGYRKSLALLRRSALFDRSPLSSKSSSVTSQQQTEDTAIFGVPLSVACERSNDVVPSIVRFGIEFLNEKGFFSKIDWKCNLIGLDEEGLYRISGNIRVMTEYKESFNKGKPINFLKLSETTYVSPHDVANIGTFLEIFNKA